MSQGTDEAGAPNSPSVCCPRVAGKHALPFISETYNHLPRKITLSDFKGPSPFSEERRGQANATQTAAAIFHTRWTRTPV